MLTMQALRTALSDDATIPSIEEIEHVLKSADGTITPNNFWPLLAPQNNQFISSRAFAMLLHIAKKNNIPLQTFLLATNRSTGKNFLMDAVQQGNKAITTLLLDTAKDEGFLQSLLESRDNFNAAILAYALRPPSQPNPHLFYEEQYAQELESAWFVDTILSAANVSYECVRNVLRNVNNAGWSAFMMAAELRNQTIVDDLLQAAHTACFLPELLEPINQSLQMAINRGDGAQVEKILTTARNRNYLMDLLVTTTPPLINPLFHTMQIGNVDIARIFLEQIRSFNQETSSTINVSKIIINARNSGVFSIPSASMNMDELFNEFGVHLSTMRTILNHTQLLGISNPIQFYMRDAYNKLTQYPMITTGNTRENHRMDFLRFMESLPPESFGESQSDLIKSIQDNYHTLFSVTPEARTADVDEMMKKIRHDKPAYCSLSWEGHTVSACFYKGYFIFTNRGEECDTLEPHNPERPYTTRFYHMGDNHVSIRPFLEKCLHNYSSPAKPFLEALQTMTAPWELVCATQNKKQRTGNCPTANSKAIIDALFAIDNGLIEIVNTLREETSREKIPFIDWISDLDNRRLLYDRWLHSTGHKKYKQITTDIRNHIIDPYIADIHRYLDYRAQSSVLTAPEEISFDLELNYYNAISMLQGYVREHGLREELTQRTKNFLNKSLDILEHIGETNIWGDGDNARHIAQIRATIAPPVSIESKLEQAQKLPQRLLQHRLKALTFTNQERGRKKVDAEVDIDEKHASPIKYK